MEDDALSLSTLVLLGSGMREGRVFPLSLSLLREGPSRILTPLPHLCSGIQEQEYALTLKMEPEPAAAAAAIHSLRDLVN